MRAVSFSFFLLLVASSGFAQDRHPGVNAVLGDVSWSLAGAPEEAPEKARLSAHLHYVHSLLSARAPSLPTSVRLRRRLLLGELLAYADDGRFPRRDPDAHVGRRPRFIDPSGVHCAVGYLMAQSGAKDLAQRIAHAHNDAYVDEITTPGVSDWASRNGFTLRELAMIQPSYDSAPTAQSTRYQIEQSLDRVTLLCAREHTPVDSFRIRVRGDGDGAVRIRTWGRNAFVACVVEHFESRGGGAYDREPESFRFRMRVAVKSPQQMLRESLRAMVLGANGRCVPREGDTPEYAAVNVSVTQQRRRVVVRTYPRNVPVANCLAADIHGRLRDFEPGAWNLPASAVLPVSSLVSDEWLSREVASQGRNDITHCLEDLGMTESAPITIDVSARRDAPAYEISVRGDSSELAACVEERLAVSLRRATSRGGAGDTPFFRIDSDASASRELQPQTRDQIQREMEDQMY